MRQLIIKINNNQIAKNDFLENGNISPWNLIKVSIKSLCLKNGFLYKDGILTPF